MYYLGIISLIICCFPHLKRGYVLQHVLYLACIFE